MNFRNFPNLRFLCFYTVKNLECKLLIDFFFLKLSRANLSDQYFTNRQDRYIVFHDCQHLCDFFDELVSTVSSMSFLLKPDNSVILHPGWRIHPSQGIVILHKCFLHF